jgi:sarcosine oxidase
LEVERVTTFWVRPNMRRGTDWAHFPVILRDHPDRPMCVFPDIDGRGVKIGLHHNGRSVDPDQIRRSVGEDEISEMRAHLEAFIPDLGGNITSASACMYTNTRDGHFAIGGLGAGRVILASACSGHGFKFAPVVAEIVTELIVDGQTAHPTDLFRLDRSSLYPVSQPVPTGALGIEAREAGGTPLPSRKQSG